MSLKIIKAGLIDTIQDAGRYGYQHLGINPTGAMDRFAAQFANALLGKELHAPLIECHFPGPVIHFEEDAVISITGADFRPLLNDLMCDMNSVIMVKKNTILKFNRMMNGARCYISILPELKIEPWLNSYSTHLKAKAGGWEGRTLKAGDVLKFQKQIHHRHDLSITLQPWVNAEVAEKRFIHVLYGAAWEKLDGSSKKVFMNDPFVVSRITDRMGYRLAGNVMKTKSNEETLSTAVAFGTIQLLPDGQLVVLMADHQTTGGYPQIAHVISADLSALAQKQPGDEIRFVFTDIQNAERKYKTQSDYLNRVKEQCNSNLEQLFHV